LARRLLPVPPPSVSPPCRSAWDRDRDRAPTALVRLRPARMPAPRVW